MRTFYLRFGLLLAVFVCGTFKEISAGGIKPKNWPQATERVIQREHSGENSQAVNQGNDASGVILLTPSQQQVVSEWVALRWVIQREKAHEKYLLFVRDLTVNATIVEELEIPKTSSAFGIGNLQPGHQYEWGIKAVNLVDPAITSSTTTQFSRTESAEHSITLGTIPNPSVCAGGTITLPYTVAGYANTGLQSFISAGTTPNGFLSESSATQTPEHISTQFSQTGENFLVRTCIVQNDLVGCSKASESFSVRSAGTVSVLNRSGSTSSLACEGTAVTLRALVQGGAAGQPRTYHWLKDGCHIIEGATDSTLTVEEAGRYQAVVTSESGCQSTSPEHTVKYTTAEVPPVLETNQYDGFRCSWDGAYIKSNTVGQGATYTWYRNDQVLLTSSDPVLSISEEGTYKVKVASATCDVTSSPLEIKTSSALALTIQTSDPYICETSPEDKYLFADIPQTETGKMRYQWLKDGVAISGADQEFLYTRSPGSYTLKVLIGNCEILSNSVGLLYGNPPQPTILNGQFPVKDTLYICAAETVTLLADVPPGGVVYWKKGDIFDNTSSLYWAITESGTYRAVVYTSSQPGACYTESRPVEVVLGSEMVVNLEGDSLLCGSNKAFLRYVGRTGSREFQWYKDGQVMVGNTFPNFYIDEPGTYALQINTHTGCQGRSKPVTVTSTPTLARPITVLGETDRCQSGGVPLRFSPGMVGTVQWKKDGVTIPGASADYYYALSSGSYSVEVTNGSCHFTSPPVPVTIRKPVSAVISGNRTNAFPNMETPLLVELAGDGPFNLTFGDSTVIKNVTGTTYQRVVSPSVTTTYGLTSVSGPCGTGTVSGLAVVNVLNSEVFSVQSGAWDDPATWNCNCIPTDEHDVEIREGHTVFIFEVQAQAKSLKFSGGEIFYPLKQELKFGK